MVKETSLPVLPSRRHQLPRAQSSLELLSQTAAVIESQYSEQPAIIEPSSLSPSYPSSSRVSPTQTHCWGDKLRLPDMGHPKQRFVLQPSSSSVGYDVTSSQPPLYEEDVPPQHPSSTFLLTAPSFSSSTSNNSLFHTSSSSTAAPFETLEDPIRENYYLRQQLATKDATIEALQSKVAVLQNEIRSLRQLPTGKISQIPLEDMLEIMREYGSEVSETAMPPRKAQVQKASVVRQFRRWNPHFLEYFDHVDGRWEPKLGKAGELKRRREARRVIAEQRRKGKEGTTTTTAI